MDDLTIGGIQSLDTLWGSKVLVGSDGSWEILLVLGDLRLNTFKGLSGVDLVGGVDIGGDVC